MIQTREIYLAMELVRCMRQACHGSGQPEGSKYHMRRSWNTRCLAEDIEVTPPLVSTDTGATASPVNRGRSCAPPGEGLALFDTFHAAQQ